MSKEMKFFILLIEAYAFHHGRPTGDVLKEWDEHGVTQEVFDGYWQYHQEAIQNAFADIDSLIATGEHAM